MIKDYNLVFQDMIDELLSDTNIDSRLKKHKDNKELDHIYKSESFIADDNIYFIGDSKYYKRGSPIETKSIYKQFTYAKNVIQYNIDLFNESGVYTNNVRYRDELCEGYNVTPNFFIRGTVENLNHFAAELTNDPLQDNSKQINNHYSGRLFDRDTLIVQSFSINFLFVLWSYISSYSTSNNSFKSAAKNKFRTSIKDYFDREYDFSKITTEGPVSDFIRCNFYSLNGRIYRPASFHDNNSFILALEKNKSHKEYLDDCTNGNYAIEPFVLR